MKQAIRFFSLTMLLAGVTIASVGSRAQADTCWSGNGISCGKEGLCCSASASTCTIFRCPPAI